MSDAIQSALICIDKFNLYHNPRSLITINFNLYHNPRSLSLPFTDKYTEGQKA